jgi:hypothetical protein
VTGSPDGPTSIEHGRARYQDSGFRIVPKETFATLPAHDRRIGALATRRHPLLKPLRGTTWQHGIISEHQYTCISKYNFTSLNEHHCLMALQFPTADTLPERLCVTGHAEFAVSLQKRLWLTGLAAEIAPAAGLSSYHKRYGLNTQ